MPKYSTSATAVTTISGPNQQAALPGSPSLGELRTDPEGRRRRRLLAGGGCGNLERRSAVRGVLGERAVADRDDAFRAFARQGGDQIVWETRTAESSEHDARAIGHVDDNRVNV